MRLLLLVDGWVGTAVFEWLAENYPDDIQLVVTKSENDISEKAHFLGIKTIIARREIDITQALEDMAETPDLGLTAWWPDILSKSVFSRARLGFLNMHPSFLPYGRGKNPNFWAVVRNEPFGATIHKIDEGIDTGPIAWQKSIPIDWEDNGETIYKKSQTALIEMFRENYARIRNFDIPLKPQPTMGYKTNYAGQLDAVCLLNLDQNYQMRHLLNLLRARTFSGNPSCKFAEGGHEYEVRIQVNRIVK